MKLHVDDYMRRLPLEHRRALDHWLGVEDLMGKGVLELEVDPAAPTVVTVTHLELIPVDGKPGITRMVPGPNGKPRRHVSTITTATPCPIGPGWHE